MSTPNEKPQQTIGLTRDDLIAILTEIRKPVKTEQELRDEASAKQDREAMMATLKQAEAIRQHKKATCSHMRPNGSTTAVFIPDLGKLYCQACSDWIAPDRPELFNRLYQLAI